MWVEGDLRAEDPNIKGNSVRRDTMFGEYC